MVTFRNKKIDPLDSIAEARILLVNTGVSRQTKKMVESVRAMRDRFPDVVDPILNAIDAVSQRMSQLVQQPPSPSTFSAIQELLSTNHHLLAGLGVSHCSLDDIHNLARAHGQAGKMTGAGGGGLAFIWLDPDCSPQKLGALQCELPSLNLIPSPNFTWLPARLGVKGVQVEKV